MKTVTLNGVRVRPKWIWSSWYKATVAAQYRAEPAPRGKNERDSAYFGKLKLYVIWLAERNGVTMPDYVDILFAAGAGSNAAPAIAIINHPCDRGYAGADPRLAGQTITVVAIPNHGRVDDAAAPGYGVIHAVTYNDDGTTRPFLFTEAA